MSPDLTDATAADELLAYCRAVEDHLTRVNGGHLVRIVGPSFDLVRGWFRDGVPLGIVTRGIDARVERHTRDHASAPAGQQPRPLRIEFCSGDVVAIFDRWRRAVGLPRVMASDVDDASDGGEIADESDTAERKRPSLTKVLDRAIDRLSVAVGRLDLPDAFRDGVAAQIAELTPLRERARGARGAAREEIQGMLPALDARVLELARTTATTSIRQAARRDAERDLAPYRTRLAAERWDAAVAAAAEQRLRELLGLPVLDW